MTGIQCTTTHGYACMHVCNDQIDFGRTYSGPATNPVDLEAKVVVLVICAENDIVLYLHMARDFSSNGHPTSPTGSPSSTNCRDLMRHIWAGQTFLLVGSRYRYRQGFSGQPTWALAQYS